VFGIKLKWWLLVGAIVPLAALVAYIFMPYCSHDPRLEFLANKLRPIIAKLEDYKHMHGAYPAKLSVIGVDDGDGKGAMGLPLIGYLAETGSNGKNEVNFAGSDLSQKIIGYEIYLDTTNGGLFYINEDIDQGWYFNYGESRQKIEL
jgi:hypothetical protein